MKNVITLVALVASFAFAGGAFAQASAPAKTLTPQQQKMSDCAKANKGKTGSTYKSAMSACLSASAPAPAPAAAASMTQQEKMASCAKANKGKKGDDYKNGMKTCMSAG